MPYLDYSSYTAWRDGRFGQGHDRLHPDYIEPVRFFGPGGIDPAAVKVTHVAEPFAIADPLIAAFASDTAARMRDEGRLYDGPRSAKLVDYDFAAAEPHITVQPTGYALQAGSCFALDLEDNRFANWGGTLRDYYRHATRQCAAVDNPLAICLGVCGLVTFSDRDKRYCLVVERAPHLASLGGTLGPSVAGVVDYSQSDTTLYELLAWSLRAEIAEEIGFGDDDYSLVPLGWAIELYRGERPQLFALIETELSREGIEDRLKSIPDSEREFTSYNTLSLDEISTEACGELNLEAGMNLRLLQEYLRVKEQ